MSVRRPAALAALAAACVPALAAQTYTLVPIREATPGRAIEVQVLNDDGVVGGQVHDGPSVQHRHGFRWTQAGGVEFAPVPRAGDDMEARRILPNGDIVAAAWPAGVPLRAITWGHGRQHTTVRGALAMSANDLGDVFGWDYYAPGQPATLWRHDGTRATMRAADGDLLWSIAGVNAAGTTTGGLAPQGSPWPQPFLWNAGEAPHAVLQVEPYGGIGVYLNDGGTMLGQALYNSVPNPLFEWSAAQGKVDLGTLPECTQYQAMGLNEDGTAIAYCVLASYDTVALVWTPAEGLRRLAGLVDASDPRATSAVIGDAVGINDGGTILVRGRDTADSAVQGWLMVPVPSAP